MACLEPRFIYQRKRYSEIPATKEQRKSERRYINPYVEGKELEYYWNLQEYLKENDPNFELIQVPCGKCDGCNISRMKDWAIRCLAESTLYEENYFLTLTYNDYNLRFNSEITSPDTGCTYCDDGSWGATLVKEDLVKFNKDLRRYFEYHYEHTGIRFYNCGEYGGQNGRPHYHGIYFNLPIPATELIPYKLTTEGMLYKCPMIEKIWGKGFITIAEVTINSCCYVAGYVMKKMRNDWGKEYYYQSGVIPEFNNMSRVPGIGKAYYDSHKEEIYSTDELIINGNKYGRPKPPRYFDKLYDIDYPTEMALIKEQRQKCADEAKYLEASKSTISAAERNKLKASELDNKTRILKRRANIENDDRKCKLV